MVGDVQCNTTLENRHTWRIVGLLCLLFVVPIVVHLIAAGLRVHRFWSHAGRIPYPVTSLSRGGGCNPVWWGNRIIYLPVLDEEDGIQRGVYATDSRGARPHVLLAGNEWFPHCCDKSGSLYLHRPGSRQLYLLQSGRDRPVAVDCGYSVQNIDVSSHGQVALLVRSPNRVVNIAITTRSLTKPRLLTHFTKANDCVDDWIPVRWYAGGTKIVFARRTYHGRHHNRQFFMLDANNGKMSSYSLPENTSGFDICPTDGRAVAYGCDEKLFVRWGDRPARVVARNYSRGGYQSIAWSPDGKQIAYDGCDGNIWLVTVQ